VVDAPLVASSGHGVVLTAMRVLAGMSGLPEWEVRLVGDGPDFAALLAMAREAGVDTHLAMLGTQDERRILPDADVLLAPSLDGEHGADAVRAAWCVGLPVVASSLDVHAGMVRHGETGLLVPVGDADALASVMVRLVRDAAGDGALAAGLVAGGRVEVARRTPERLAAAHLDIYHEQAGAVRRSLQAAGG
jgi:glycosyltransferase involved in cell wall biosynthesis